MFILSAKKTGQSTELSGRVLLMCWCSGVLAKDRNVPVVSNTTKTASMAPPARLESIGLWNHELVRSTNFDHKSTLMLCSRVIRLHSTRRRLSSTTSFSYRSATYPRPKLFELFQHLLHPSSYDQLRCQSSKFPNDRNIRSKPLCQSRIIPRFLVSPILKSRSRRPKSQCVFNDNPRSIPTIWQSTSDQLHERLGTNALIRVPAIRTSARPTKSTQPFHLSRSANRTLWLFR